MTEDPITCGIRRLRDWVYEHYFSAYLIGTGIILYSLTFPHLQAFAVAYFAVVLAGVLLEPCVNPSSDRYGVSLRKGSSEKGLHVALTFDDGPGPDTAALLDALRRHEVRATFFCVGRQARLYPELVRRIVEEGHQLGNHTMTHANLMTSKPAEALREIEETRALLQDLSGVTVSAVRPPFGYRAPWTVPMLKKRGEQSVLWSINPRDFQDPGADVITERVLAELHPGAVVLLHDGFEGRAQTLQAIDRLVPRLRAEGYRFVRVEDL